MAPLNDGDRVVRELDVYLCSDVLPQNTKLLLVQYPLRPPWRPYDAHGYDKIRMKPKAVKVEIEAPLPKPDTNYDTAAERSKKIDKIKLTSSKVDMRTTFACGSIRGDKLLLTPIDHALQLRPSVSHLNELAPQKAREETEEADGPLLPFQVQMKKRETERQQQARLQSYAYLTQQVEEEPWLSMEYHDSYSQAAENVWEKMMTAPTEQQIEMNMTRKQYLNAIVPGMSSRSTPAAPPAVPSDAPAPLPGDAMKIDGGEPGAAPPAQQFVPSQEAAKALPVALLKFFRKHMVCNINNIRSFLESQGSAAEYCVAPESDFHSAIMAAGPFVHLHNVYTLAKLGNAALDPFRDVVINLFKEKECLKKADIMEAARAAGLQVNEQLYSKVVRSLCVSKGAQWFLRQGV